MHLTKPSVMFFNQEEIRDVQKLLNSALILKTVISVLTAVSIQVIGSNGPVTIVPRS